MNSKKVYLCAIIDLFDNKIVAYYFSQKQMTQLVLNTLKLTIQNHPGTTTARFTVIAAFNTSLMGLKHYLRLRTCSKVYPGLENVLIPV